MLVINKAKELSKVYNQISESKIIEFIEKAIPDLNKEWMDINTKIKIADIAEYVKLKDGPRTRTILFNKTLDILRDKYKCLAIYGHAIGPDSDKEFYFNIVKNRLTKYLICWNIDYIYNTLEGSMILDGYLINIADSIIYMLSTIFEAAETGEKACFIYKDKLDDKLDNYIFLHGECELNINETDDYFEVSGWI